MWIKRTEGKITSSCPSWWEGVDTEIDDNDPELLAFLNPPEDPNYIISKMTPWIRMTDTEAATVSVAMKTQSARFQAIYEAASNLNTADELYGTLKQFLSAVLSPARANELLAKES